MLIGAQEVKPLCIPGMLILPMATDILMLFVSFFCLTQYILNNSVVPVLVLRFLFLPSRKYEKYKNSIGSFKSD